MNKIVFLVLLAVSLGNASAQETLPSSITPLNGSVTLRYSPKFESRCIIKKSEKKPGEFFGTKTTESVLFEVFEESGRTKHSIKVTLGSDYFLRMIFGLGDDRTLAGATDMDIQSNIEDINKNKDKYGKLFLGLMKKLSGGSAAYGRPLIQGSKLHMDGDVLSSIFGSDEGKIGTNESAESAGSTGFNSVGKLLSEMIDSSVIGTANIRGRESIVFSGEKVLEIGRDDKRASLKSKIWEAYDLQSGLLSGSSTLMVVGNAEKGVTTITEDRECTITGEPIKAMESRLSNDQKAKPSEQRLIELKTLLDKSLITQEQFENKRTEILNSL